MPLHCLEIVVSLRWRDGTDCNRYGFYLLSALRSTIMWSVTPYFRAIDCMRVQWLYEEPLTTWGVKEHPTIYTRGQRVPHNLRERSRSTSQSTREAKETMFTVKEYTSQSAREVKGFTSLSTWVRDPAPCHGGGRGWLHSTPPSSSPTTHTTPLLRGDAPPGTGEVFYRFAWLVIQERVGWN